MWRINLWKRETSDAFESSRNYVFSLADYKYEHENWRKWHLQSQSPKKHHVFHITLINIGFMIDIDNFINIGEKCLR